MLAQAELASAGLIAKADRLEEGFIFLVAGISRNGGATIVDRLLLVVVDRDPRPRVDFDILALAAIFR